MFGSPNCKFCILFHPTFVNFANKNSEKILVAEFNCEQDGEEFCDELGITRYPRVIMFNNNRMLPYQGDRTLEDLEDFAFVRARAQWDQSIESEPLRKDAHLQSRRFAALAELIDTHN